MTVPELDRSYSFPFLSIARRFSTDYASVLIAADIVVAGKDEFKRSAIMRPLSVDCFNAILDEVAWQRRISNGEVEFDANPFIASGCKNKGGECGCIKYCADSTAGVRVRERGVP